MVAEGEREDGEGKRGRYRDSRSINTLKRQDLRLFGWGVEWGKG